MGGVTLTTEVHVLTIEPPDYEHKDWLVSCSFKDLINRAARTRAQAKEIAFGHVMEVQRKAVETEGLPGITKVESMDDFSELFRTILKHPLDIDGSM